MNSLWDFKVGDRVFCVWPYGKLAGGYHKVIDVLPGHIKVEGFKYYYEKERFVLLNPYVSANNKNVITITVTQPDNWYQLSPGNWYSNG